MQSLLLTQNNPTILAEATVFGEVRSMHITGPHLIPNDVLTAKIGEQLSNGKRRLSGCSQLLLLDLEASGLFGDEDEPEEESLADTPPHGDIYISHGDVVACLNVTELPESVFIEGSFIQRHQFSSFLSLSQLILSKDENTGYHQKRVREYTRLFFTEELMQRHNIPHDIAVMIVRCSVLHDIGKLHIPDDVLLKAGPLNDQELIVMKTHTCSGANLLLDYAGKTTSVRESAGLIVASTIARFHHEKGNGQGYLGLKGDDIPLAAKIVSMADMYDAMTSIRPYRSEPFSHEDLETIFREGRGIIFDPLLVDIFLHQAEHFKRYAKRYADSIEETESVMKG